MTSKMPSNDSTCDQDLFFLLHASKWRKQQKSSLVIRTTTTHYHCCITRLRTEFRPERPRVCWQTFAAEQFQLLLGSAWWHEWHRSHPRPQASSGTHPCRYHGNSNAKRTGIIAIMPQTINYSIKYQMMEKFALWLSTITYK